MTKRDAKAKLNRLAQDLGRFPLIDELAQTWGLSPSQTKSVLTMWVKDAYLLESSEGTYQINPAYKSRTVSGSVTGNPIPEPELVIPDPEKDRDPEPFIDLSESTKPKAPKQKNTPAESSTDDAMDAVRVAVEYQAQSESYTPEPVAEPESENIKVETLNDTPEGIKKIKAKWRAEMKYFLDKGGNVLRAKTRRPIAAVNYLRNKLKRRPLKPVPRKPLRQSGVVALIRVVMGVIGIGAAVISMYYTSRFTQELFPHVFLAYLLSGIMVGFNIMAFELILLFGNGQATTHWFRWPAAFTFFLLWIIVGGFSITATIAGQYNQHATRTTKAAMDSGSPKVLAIKYTNILTRKRLYEKQIKDAQTQNDVLNKKQDEIKNDPEQAILFQQNSWSITANNTQITKATTQYTKAVDEETVMLNEHPEISAMAQTEIGTEVPDFYGFLARVFGVTRDVVQFWTSLFPAVFVDVIAPIAAAAALFLRGRK